MAVHALRRGLCPLLKGLRVGRDRRALIALFGRLRPLRRRARRAGRAAQLLRGRIGGGRRDRFCSNRRLAVRLAVRFGGIRGGICRAGLGDRPFDGLAGCNPGGLALEYLWLRLGFRRRRCILRGPVSGLPRFGVGRNLFCGVGILQCLGQGGSQCVLRRIFRFLRGGIGSFGCNAINCAAVLRICSWCGLVCLGLLYHLDLRAGIHGCRLLGIGCADIC